MPLRRRRISRRRPFALHANRILLFSIRTNGQLQPPLTQEWLLTTGLDWFESDLTGTWLSAVENATLGGIGTLVVVVLTAITWNPGRPRSGPFMAPGRLRSGKLKTGHMAARLQTP